jgi:hypothetical protein
LSKEAGVDYLSKFLISFPDPSRIEQALSGFSTKYSGTDASRSNESQSGLHNPENQVLVKYAILGCLTFIGILVVVGISLFISESKPPLIIPNVADSGELRSFQNTPPPVLEAHKLGYKVLFLEGIPHPTSGVGNALLGPGIYCIINKDRKILVVHKFHSKNNREGNLAYWADSNYLANMEIKSSGVNVNNEWSLEERDASNFSIMYKHEMHNNTIKVKNLYTFTINILDNTWKLDHNQHLETKEQGSRQTNSTLGTGKASWHR